MTNKHQLPFVAAGDVTEPVRGVRGKSPASPPTGCTHRKGKNCTKEEKNMTVLLSKFLVGTEGMLLLRRGLKGSKRGMRETENREILVK